MEPYDYVEQETASDHYGGECLKRYRAGENARRDIVAGENASRDIIIEKMSDEKGIRV